MKRRRCWQTAAAGCCALTSASISQVEAAVSTNHRPVSFPNYSYGGGASSDDEGEDWGLESSSEFEDDAADYLGDDPSVLLPPLTTATSLPASSSSSATASMAEINSADGATSSDDTENTAPSQPLQTLQKLQQMLDETDYRTSTTAPNSGRNARLPATPTTRPPPAAASPSIIRPPAPPLHQQEDRLWKPQDRYKYKQQQQRHRRRPKFFRPEVTSDEGGDEGLGYSLPSLPIYLSDDEGDEEERNGSTDESIAADARQQGSSASSSTLVQPLSPRASEQQEPSRNFFPDSAMYPSPGQPLHRPYQQQQSQPPQGPYYAPQGYGYPHWQPAPNAAALANHGYAAPPYTPWNYPAGGNWMQSPQLLPPSDRPAVTSNAPTTEITANAPRIIPFPVPMGAVVPPTESGTLSTTSSLLVTGSKLSWSTVHKLTLLGLLGCLGSYAAVSPRNLPLDLYNLRFYENVQTLALVLVAPCIYLWSVADWRLLDVNQVVGQTLVVAATAGYLFTWLAELAVTTIIRLGVFGWLEPGMFTAARLHEVPLPVVPWVLREIKYRPKRITLLGADVLTSCLACPIIEELLKWKLVQWTVDLPGRRRRDVSPAEPVVSANRHVTHMLAASLGWKVADASRRVLLYTKPYHEHGRFFAMARGIFPIPELCGTLTALNLAKRDLLGLRMPAWRILLPAVAVHAMANFRGKKPLFKWNSATPWSELQISPRFPSHLPLVQLLKKGYPKLMWMIIMGRVLGYCVKNYYLVNRQAVKRTTTYAGKQSAFSAELATAELLKRNRKD